MLRVRMSSWFSGCLLLGMLCNALSAAEAGVEAKATTAQIQEWLKQLASEDYDAREKAEQALKKAGTAAIPLVTAAMEAGDAETKLRGGRILDELNWAVRPAVTDFASVLSSDSILLIQTPGLKEAVAKMRSGTPAGKFYDNPSLATLKSALGQLYSQELHMDDAAKEFALSWLERYGGPAAFAFSVKSEKGEELERREDFLLLLGLNAPDSAKAFADFQSRFPVVGGQISQERYRGIDFTFSNRRWIRDAMARVKNLLVRSSSQESMKGIIDALAGNDAASLAKFSGYVESLSKVDLAPLASLFLNMEQVQKGIKQGRNAEYSALGFEEFKSAIVSLQVKDGLFVEQAYCKVVGERRGLTKLLSLPKSPGKLAALCPAGALGFVSLPMSGKDLYADIVAMSEKLDPADTENFKTWLSDMDQALGLKIVDQQIPSIRGEAVLWAMRPKGVLPYPDLGAVVETKDAAAAAALAEALGKLAGKMGGADAVGSTTYKGRTCFWHKKEAIAPEFPYTFSWCADGARLMASSSQEGLQGMLNRVDGGAPGMDSSEDYKKLLERIPAQARGGLAYVNTAELAAWGYAVGLPLLAELAPEDFKGKLSDMPKDTAALFKDFPGTLLAVAMDEQGVRAQAAGGIPVAGMFLAAPMTYLFSRPMKRRARAEKAMLEAKEAMVEPVKQVEKTQAAPKEEKEAPKK